MAFFKELLGEHANPGHTLEDMWFIADAADILGNEALYSYAARTATRALEIGWDEPMGPVTLFVHYGGPPSAAGGWTGGSDGKASSRWQGR
jgi:N-acylglucosamine 2-epimerase